MRVEDACKRPGCGKRFAYEINAGKRRKYCSDACRALVKKVNAAARLAVAESCTGPKCNNAARYAKSVCNSCYKRIKRIGTVERIDRRKREHRTDAAKNVQVEQRG